MGKGYSERRHQNSHPKKKLLQAKKGNLYLPLIPHPLQGGVLCHNDEDRDCQIWRWWLGDKYTNSKTSLSLCSGWITQGKEKYARLLRHIKNVRNNKPTTPAKEELAYAQDFIKKNGVTQANHAEFLQAKKRAQNFLVGRGKQ
jgi:hypothetical protein